MIHNDFITILDYASLECELSLSFAMNYNPSAGNALKQKVQYISKTNQFIIAYTGCTYNGHTHMMGERFNSVDGCNTCHCQEDGTYRCTTEACMPSK